MIKPTYSNDNMAEHRAYDLWVANKPDKTKEEIYHLYKLSDGGKITGWLWSVTDEEIQEAKKTFLKRKWL